MALFRPLSKQRRKVEEKLERRKNKWNKKKAQRRNMKTEKKRGGRLPDMIKLIIANYTHF